MLICLETWWKPWLFLKVRFNAVPFPINFKCQTVSNLLFPAFYSIKSELCWKVTSSPLWYTLLAWYNCCIVHRWWPQWSVGKFELCKIFNKSTYHAWFLQLLCWLISPELPEPQTSGSHCKKYFTKRANTLHSFCHMGPSIMWRGTHRRSPRSKKSN